MYQSCNYAQRGTCKPVSQVRLSSTVGAAIFQGGLFGLSAQFPPKYLTAVLSGQALGAVFACLARLVSVSTKASKFASTVSSPWLKFTTGMKKTQN